MYRIAFTDRLSLRRQTVAKPRWRLCASWKLARNLPLKGHLLKIASQQKRDQKGESALVIPVAEIVLGAVLAVVTVLAVAIPLNGVRAGSKENFRKNFQVIQEREEMASRETVFQDAKGGAREVEKAASVVGLAEAFVKVVSVALVDQAAASEAAEASEANGVSGNPGTENSAASRKNQDFNGVNCV